MAFYSPMGNDIDHENRNLMIKKGELEGIFM